MQRFNAQTIQLGSVKNPKTYWIEDPFLLPIGHNAVFHWRLSQLLHRKAFAPSSFLTQTPSRRAPFTQAFTQSSFYAQMLLHTDAGTQSSLHPQILLHSEASFCTQTLLQGAAFTQKHFYTEKPLQSSFYTESGSDRVQTGLKITGPRAHPSAGPGRIGDNGENRPKKWKANWSLSSF